MTDKRNLTMLMDFYELTMGNGYLENGMGDTIVYFDMFFRRVPENGGYAIFAGLEQVIDCLLYTSWEARRKLLIILMLRI